MRYQGIGYGPEDVRLGVGELLAVAAGEEDSMYVSSNVVLIDPTLTSQAKIVEENGMKIGITSVLDPASLEIAQGEEILIEPPAKAAQKGLVAITLSDFKVMMFFGKDPDWKSEKKKQAE